jgi:hypothetical protein
MKPSQVRDYIGHQHIQLRILFVEVENACRDALDGRGDARPLLGKLVREVLDHITVEDRVLLPALREIDAWGPARAAHVAAEHAKQREELAALRNLARLGPGDEAARVGLDMISALMIDMDGEERDLLGPDLLRDDLVVISQSDG